MSRYAEYRTCHAIPVPCNPQEMQQIIPPIITTQLPLSPPRVFLRSPNQALGQESPDRTYGC
jgi:hypothetical protein